MAMLNYETVNLINRTKRVLTCMFDGDIYYINPGPNPGFLKILVPFAKNQNVRMGTQDPYVTSKFESLVGIEGTKDPIDPVDESKERAVERINRSMVMGAGRHATPMEGRIFSPADIREEDGTLSLDAVFGEGKR